MYAQFAPRRLLQFTLMEPHPYLMQFGLAHDAG
jgi:hypothetical protein